MLIFLALKQTVPTKTKERNVHCFVHRTRIQIDCKCLLMRCAFRSGFLFQFLDRRLRRRLSALHSSTLPHRFHFILSTFYILFVFFDEILAHSVVLLDHQDFCRHVQFVSNYFDPFSNYSMPFHSYLPDSFFCFQETKLNHLSETGNKNSESLALQIINFGNMFCFLSFLYILICSTAHSISFRFRYLCSFFSEYTFQYVRMIYEHFLFLISLLNI